MGRRLIVANQTLGGEQLGQRVRERIEEGRDRFYVVVPMIEPERESSAWAAADPMFGDVPPAPQANAEAVEVAQQRSRHRLDAMLRKITELGGDADGEVGPTDPIEAVSAALEEESFDEVLVSTLPAGLSRWIKMDLPSRIDRMVDCPVVTVEADA